MENNYPFEVSMALSLVSRGLRHARLLRKDSQLVAAQRAGVSLATYRRMESGDPDVIGSIAFAPMLSALCAYGFTDDVLRLGDPARDARAQELVGRSLPKRARTKRKNEA